MTAKMTRTDLIIKTGADITRLGLTGEFISEIFKGLGLENTPENTKLIDEVFDHLWQIQHWPSS